MAKKKKKVTKAKKVTKKAKTAKKAVKKKAVKKAVKKKVAKKAAPKKAAKKAAKKVTPKKVVKKAAPKKVAKKAKAEAKAKKIEAPKEVASSKVKSSKKYEKKATSIKEDLGLEEIVQEVVEADVVLTDAEGRRYCKVSDCDQIANVDQYCRYHYLLFWNKIQNRKKILADGKLQRYVEELTARYSDKFIEILRKDLRTEKDFLNTIHELELDEGNSAQSSYEEEDKSYIEEIRGVAADNSSRAEDDY